jgi:hypothetical protein
MSAAHVPHMPTTSRFSVRHIPWIPASTAHGLEHLSLDETLARAHEISHIDARDPIVRAAVNRFLIAAGTLVARSAQVTKASARNIAVHGFTQPQIDTALDPLNERLFLIHAATPFMQSPLLFDLAAEAESKEFERPAALLPRTPGSAGKAWFDAAGDIYNDEDLTPTAAALALVTHWSYSPKSNKGVLQTVELPDVDGTLMPTTLKWLSLGSPGLAGFRGGRSNNVTYWHRGDTLAEFLMLNIAEHWLDEDSVPAWASEYAPGAPLDSLAGHTFTANAVMLGFDEDVQRFTTAIRGGFVLGTDPAAAKVWATDQLLATAEEDPSRPWIDLVVTNPGETKGRPVRALFDGFTLTHSTSQNLRAWFLDGVRPTLRYGVLRSRNRSLDVLSIGTAVTMGTPQIVSAGWLTVEGNHLEPENVADELVAELADTGARKPEKALKAAILTVFPPAGPRQPHAAFESTFKHAVRTFHTLLEPVFADAVATVLSGGEPTALVRQLRSATLEAFDSALSRYVSARTLPDIARGRALLTAGANTAPDTDRVPDATAQFVGRFINQIQSDNGFRTELARGVTAETEAGAIHRMPFLADLQTSAKNGVVRGIGILATHPRMVHQKERKLGSALATLTVKNGNHFDGVGGISATVGLLPSLDLEQATVVLSGLAGRLSRDRVGVNFHDFISVLSGWDQPDYETQTAHRNDLVYAYHAASPQK